MDGDNSLNAGRRARYGWVVVGVAFSALFVNYGIRYTSTVLFKEMVSDLGLSRGAGSVPFTVLVAVYAVGAPVVGRLTDRFGPRYIISGGFLLAGVALLLCSRISSLLAFVMLFGLLFGIGGNGIGLVPSNTAVAFWFDSKLGLALGVASVGIGLGTVLLPPITQLVLSAYSWRASFIFLGALTLSLSIPSFFLLKNGKNAKSRSGPLSSSGTTAVRHGATGPARESAAAPVREPAGSVYKTALRDADFWKLFISFVLVVIAIYGVMLHQVPFATDRGITKGTATLSVTVVGAFSIAGRFFFGFLSDRTRIRKRALYPAFVMVALALLILTFTRNAATLMLFAVVFGSGYAAYGPVIPALVADVFGKRNMGTIFGAITAGGAIGGALGPYITGAIYDATGTYTWAWMTGIVCTLVAMALIASVRSPQRQPDSPALQHPA